MKSLSSLCCEELNPLFDEIADLSIKRDNEKEYSSEWKETDRELETLFHKAQVIFYHYNPEFKQYGKKR